MGIGDIYIYISFTYLDLPKVCKKFVPFHQKNIYKKRGIFFYLPGRSKVFFDLFFWFGDPVRSQLSQQEAPELPSRKKDGGGTFGVSHAR